MRSGLIFIHPSDELYGADRMLLELVAALPSTIEAQVWLPTDLPHRTARLCEELESRGVRVRHLDLPVMRRSYRTPRGLTALVGRATKLYRELRAARPALVYCTSSATFLSAPVARITGVRRVVGHVQEIWSGADRMALLPSALACHGLLAISGPVRDSLPARLRTRTRVVHNATPEPARRVCLEGRTGSLRFLVASRWNSWKGHRTLLAAWDGLEKPGQLTILGGPPASGESVDVVSLVAALARPELVTVVGDVQDPAPFIADADVVLMPSDDPEPFGLVAIEAFAQGRPVIASDGGGLSEIVEDSLTGWLFPPRDVAALRRVIDGLTRNEVEAAGFRARRSYEEHYTTAAYGGRWRQAMGFEQVNPEPLPEAVE